MKRVGGDALPGAGEQGTAIRSLPRLAGAFVAEYSEKNTTAEHVHCLSQPDDIFIRS